MSDVLWEYHRPAPATWAYFSSLLTLALYFVFHRFWSVRNLDLILIVLLAPGLLLVETGRRVTLAVQQTAAPAQRDQANSTVATDLEFDTPLDVSSRGVTELSELALGRSLQVRGFYWLFAVGALMLIRCLLDTSMVRRPLLDPNLSPGGLAFLGGAILVFLLGNLLFSLPEVQDGMARRGPGYPLLAGLPNLPVSRPADSDLSVGTPLVMASRLLGSLATLTLITGIVLVGYRHFNNFKAGIGAAVLYLLCPYVFQMSGHLDHIVPAAFLVWAILLYRRPLGAGICLGIAAGLIYYPLFLLPLWTSFYWRRGLGRFGIGVTVTLLLLVGGLAIADQSLLLMRLREMFGLFAPAMTDLEGIWGLAWNPTYRLPVLTGFMILSFSFAFWPGQKNLGTLLSCSGALMIAVQFWHGFGGGLYVAWYLPLVLLTVFRPNLEDRVALKVIGSSPMRRDLLALSDEVEAA